MHILGGDFPVGPTMAKKGWMAGWAVNNVTVVSVDFIDEVERKNAGKSLAKWGYESVVGAMMAGGIGWVVGGKDMDVRDLVTRFDVRFRSGKVAHCVGSPMEYQRLRRSAEVGPGEDLLPLYGRTGMAPSLTDRDRLRSELQAEKSADKAKKEASKAAARAHREATKPAAPAQREPKTPKEPSAFRAEMKKIAEDGKAERAAIRAKRAAGTQAKRDAKAAAKQARGK